jgi:uncharacterized protein
MDPVTPAAALVTLLMGTIAGSLGAMLGIGGGVFLVPFLILVVGLPFHQAAAVSLAAVVATSTAVSAATVSRHLVNLRLGMALEVATAAGGLAGGLTAQMLSPAHLQVMFAVFALFVAGVVVRRGDARALPDNAETGRLGGRFVDERTGASVTYAVHRLPAALVASCLAGNLSTLLGLGGGIIKVPVLVTWCGVPMRVAAATSSFMIGVTATSGAVVYYGHGDLIPVLAASAVVGTQMGSVVGLWVGARARAYRLRLLLAGVLVTVAVMMLVRSL